MGGTANADHDDDSLNDWSDDAFRGTLTPIDFPKEILVMSCGECTFEGDHSISPHSSLEQIASKEAESLVRVRKADVQPGVTHAVFRTRCFITVVRRIRDGCSSSPTLPIEVRTQ